jgi:hypothetical protein
MLALLTKKIANAYMKSLNNLVTELVDLHKSRDFCLEKWLRKFQMFTLLKATINDVKQGFQASNLLDNLTLHSMYI